MKQGELEELIGYRLERAVEALEEARFMRQAGHWNACANRLYYAAFYAVSALLVKGGHSSSKHSGVRAIFNQYYVKPNHIEKAYGRLYRQLFDLRQEGDYIDFVKLDADTVEPLIEQTARFVQAIKSLISKTCHRESGAPR